LSFKRRSILSKRASLPCGRGALFVVLRKVIGETAKI
jgi:hypothetical protein